MNSNWIYSPETLNSGRNWWYVIPCDLEICWMTLENNRAPLLCHFKLCASFRSHWWIQTGVIVRKHPIWVKFDNFFSRVTLKFDGWPWKKKGHHFIATSSFVHYFLAIGEFKLELQSGNAQSDGNAQCDLEIWRMNLKNNKAPLQCYFKLCALFRSHWWIQTWVTVRKRPIWVKFDDF